jgi:hypothetical protein
MPLIATSNTIYRRYENNKIVGIELVRNPISKYIINLLKTIGGKKFQTELANLAYDKLFHLRMILTFDNGSKVSVEKLDTIEINTNSKIPVVSNTLKLSPPTGELTFKTLMEKTKQKMGDKFYPYSAFNNNCQDFLLNILSANNLNTPESTAFIKQDTKSLFRDNAFLRKTVNTITNISSVATKIGARTQNQLNRIATPITTAKEIVKRPEILLEFI